MLFGMFLSCSEKGDSKTEFSTKNDCGTLYMEKNYQTLTGTLIIDTKGEFLFKSISDDTLGIFAPTFLVPCSESLKEYIEGQYIGFASVRKLEEEFWITVTGSYLNLESYKNQDSDFVRLEFLFDNVSLVENPLESKAFMILDSINSINCDDLIKINSGRCINNCLPKQSFYKLTGNVSELRKIGYEVEWHNDLLKYTLVRKIN